MTVPVRADMRRIALTAVALVVVVAATLAWRAAPDDASDAAEATFVIAPVERRTLVDEITVRGQIRRDELQRITSPIEGQISDLRVQPGDTVVAGDTILALSGRAAVAVPGAFSFFRPLDVGAEGPDVRQLEEILHASGHDVGTIDDRFTETTRSALAAWQADRGYGGATTETDESLDVALRSGSGYSVGALDAIGYVIGGAAPSVSPMRLPTPLRMPPGDGPRSIDTTSTTVPPPTPSVPVPSIPVPSIDVRVEPGRVVEGGTATFRFTSDIVVPTDTVIDVVVGGDATPDDDYEALDGTFVFPGGATTFDLVVVTTADEVIEADEELVVTVGTAINVDPDARYRPGALKQARLTIGDPPGEVATIGVTTEQAVVGEGGVAQFVFEADRERNEDTTISYLVGGSAASGDDYAPVEGEVELPAGSTEVTLAIQTIADRLVEADETIAVTLVAGTDHRIDPRPAQVVVESPDVPELVLEGGGRLAEGATAVFAIVADQAPVVDTAIGFAFGGSATPGVDYRTIAGSVVLRAGERRVEVAVDTIDDDVVFRPGDMIVADWPARVGSVSVDEGEFVLLGSELLTLTEPEFTISLQLSPTDRANLSVGLDATIDLQASRQEPLPGVITELDDSATIDQGGNETYEGVVETDGDLDAVDGANVNVDVVLERRTDAITVPVAAVLQDGSGDDVVRVVLDDGTTRQVRVEVGLAEGAFVEIRTGLVGNELVLVET
jgi:multidrug efflux pump subunit AcrA (membrane-fusion protein)